MMVTSITGSLIIQQLGHSDKADHSPGSASDSGLAVIRLGTNTDEQRTSLQLRASTGASPQKQFPVKGLEGKGIGTSS